MLRVVVRTLLVSITLWSLAQTVPGIHIEGVGNAILAAIVLGILNSFVRPVLVVLTFPITVLTLGLFIFILNALLFWFASTFLSGFEVETLLAALIGSVLVSLISGIVNKAL